MVHGVLGQDVGLLGALVDIDRIDHGHRSVAGPLVASVQLIGGAAYQIGWGWRVGKNAPTRRRATLPWLASWACTRSGVARDPGPRNVGLALEVL